MTQITSAQAKAMRAEKVAYAAEQIEAHMRARPAQWFTTTDLLSGLAGNRVIFQDALGVLVEQGRILNQDIPGHKGRQYSAIPLHANPRLPESRRHQVMRDILMREHVMTKGVLVRRSCEHLNVKPVVAERLLDDLYQGGLVRFTAVGYTVVVRPA